MRQGAGREKTLILGEDRWVVAMTVTVGATGIVGHASGGKQRMQKTARLTQNTSRTESPSPKRRG